MVKLMTDLPDNVLGMYAEGKITAADYETVLIPAVEEKLRTNKKMRVLYQIADSFEGFELKAMLDDAKIGIGDLSAWEKLAVVSDHHLINSTARFFGHFMICEIRIFSTADLDAAKKWVSEPVADAS